MNAFVLILTALHVLHSLLGCCWHGAHRDAQAVAAICHRAESEAHHEGEHGPDDRRHDEEHGHDCVYLPAASGGTDFQHGRYLTPAFESPSSPRGLAPDALTTASLIEDDSGPPERASSRRQILRI